MLTTELYIGQGLGNQLWCYCVTRVIALDRELDFGVMSPEKFKGADFMSLDFGYPVRGGEGPEGGPPKRLPEGFRYYYREQRYNHPTFECDVTPFDPGLVLVPDRTKLDGAMQAERYILHRKAEICEWLKPTRQVNDFIDDNLCVIHVRGGDFVGIQDVFLPPQYYRDAMQVMKAQNPNMRFVCITDHPEAAHVVLEGKVPVVGAAATSQQDSRRAPHHFGGPIWMDYCILNSARYSIIPNSSFAWWATWTNPQVRFVVAPKYWARYNISDGFWSQGDSLTSGWHYMDRYGKLSTYDQCGADKTLYESVRVVK
jgi:hypothetical protein